MWLLIGAANRTMPLFRGLTFELSCLRRQTAGAAWRMICQGATRPLTAAVAGQLERGVRQQYARMLLGLSLWATDPASAPGQRKHDCGLQLLFVLPGRLPISDPLLF
jgi:hypothetical protein